VIVPGMLIALQLVACGGSISDGSTTTSPSGAASSLRTTFFGPEDASQEDIQLTQRLLQERLEALGYQDVEVTPQAGDSYAIKVQASPSLAADWPHALRVVVRQGDIQLREVLGYAPAGEKVAHEPTCDGVGCLTPSMDRQEVALRSADDSSLYTLGPVLLSGEAIAKAQAQPESQPSFLDPAPSPSDVWTVVVTLTPEGSDTFAAVTSRLSPERNGGLGKQLAMVVDGRVISAPTVQGKIVGSFLIAGGPKDSDEQGATDLAFLLSSPALPLPLATGPSESPPVSTITPASAQPT
jgi:SecD/SecF fusion protein